MSDPRGMMDRIRHAAPAVDPALTDREVEQMIEGLPQRRRRRAVGRVGRMMAATAVVGIAIAVFSTRASNKNVSGPSAWAWPAALTIDDSAAVMAPPLRLADGSVATRLDASAALAIVENSPERVTLDLRRGRERFEVVPRPAAERSFHVRAGQVTVTVIGTVFTVERVADRIGVSVERGIVHVDWGQGARPLRAGESGWFPPLALVDPAADPQSPATAIEERPTTAPPLRAERRPQTAEPTAAAAASTVAPPPAALDAPSAEQILRAADTARMTGRAGEAATLLQRLVSDRPDDPRAPLAAFTLGRLLMRELGRPRDAATAFAEARALAPAGPLAGDALAREAESLSQAGAPDQARDRAREYLRLYPAGHRVPALKALGGPD